MSSRQRTSCCLCLLLILIMLASVVFLVSDGNRLSAVSDACYSGEPAPAMAFTPQPYGCALAASALISLLCFILFSGRKQAFSTTLTFSALSLLGGFVLARLLFCLSEFAFYFHVADISFLFRFADGGYAMTGALLGVLLAAVTVSRKDPTFSFKALALSMPIFIFLARLSEAFASTGIGPDLEDEMFLSMEGDWGPVLNVRLLEAIIALVLFVILLIVLLRSGTTYQEVRGLLLFLVLYGSLQIILESMRQEGHMVWGFVKAQQLTSFGFAAVAAGLLTFPRGKLRFSLSCISSVMLAALTLFCEKNLDRNYFNWPREWIYASFLFLILLYILSILILSSSKNQSEA